jgi:hypothetical protein
MARRLCPYCRVYRRSILLLYVNIRQSLYKLRCLLSWSPSEIVCDFFVSRMLLTLPIPHFMVLIFCKDQKQYFFPPFWSIVPYLTSNYIPRDLRHTKCDLAYVVGVSRSFVPHCVLLQVHSLFQSEFSVECDLMLPLSVYSFLSLP